MGDIEVPADALWGASTERARRNFEFGDRPLPPALIAALGRLKGAIADAHVELGLIEPEVGRAIATAAGEVARGELDAWFPVGVFQTGSGTSTNMNVNEVIAHRATTLLANRRPVHPNDDVNRGQSSNDVFPSAIQIALAIAIHSRLRAELTATVERFHALADEHFEVSKLGRTHLMDAMPIRLGQEFRGHASQLERAGLRLQAAGLALCELPLGGTAVGTGINADPRVAPLALQHLASATGLPLCVTPAPFQSQAALDVVVAAVAALRGIALALQKVTGDLAWMASGPRAGLGEIRLPALQPGSSIMPGKVNPVICEAVLMACTKVVGCDAIVAAASGAGRFQLHTMMPLVATEALDAVDLLRCALAALRTRVLDGLEVEPTLAARVAGHPILATALAPLVGYDRAAEIAKTAERTGRSVLEVALAEGVASAAELRALLDPTRLAGERGRTRE